MTRYSITREELKALNPCDLDERLELFGGRERLTVAQALEAGATVEDVLWAAGRMGHKAECVRFAVACAESVAHLTPDPRVRAAIDAAKAWIASPTEENAAAAYAAYVDVYAVAYSVYDAAYTAANAAYTAYSANAAYASASAAYTAAIAAYVAGIAGEPLNLKTLLLKIFA